MSDQQFEILFKEISSLKEQIKEQNIPYMLTKEDLVKHYNMSESYQAKWRSTKQADPIPYVLIGGGVQYIRPKLEEWIERQTLNAS